VGRESKRPHEMFQRDSESPVRRIKILMESGDYISPDFEPGISRSLDEALVN